ncbi:MAG: hypothetical protein ABSC51_03105 [Gaiellaceae bacterium]|jgi:hypothetical protein
MKRHPKRPADHLDAFLEAGDPVDPAPLRSEGIETALDEIGISITNRTRPTPRAAWRRVITRPRAALVIGFAVVGTGAAVAASSQLSAHTGQYMPKREVPMGGPGEILNPSAPDFKDVALQISSDIPFPKAYERWREAVIAANSFSETDVQVSVSSGALHGFFAMSAFCAWVLDWRHAEVAGDTAAAGRAAQVISEAPSWEAVTDEDPHPDPTVPGDGGFIHSTVFGWMLPYRDAVLAGDRAHVEHLLATHAYGGTCQINDWDWRALMTAHRSEWRDLSTAEWEQKYEQYLASRTS